MCQKEETPSVSPLGALKDTEAKGEWKVRDAADLQVWDSDLETAFQLQYLISPGKVLLKIVFCVSLEE